MSDLTAGDKVRATLNGEVGFKVRATFSGELGFMDGDYAEVVTSGPLGYVVPLHLTEDGVSVVPADEPTPYERALTSLADSYLSLEESARRCTGVGADGHARTYEAEAGAVRSALIAVMLRVATAEGRDDPDTWAVVRAGELIAEAAKHRG